MNKIELVEKIALDLGVTKVLAGQFVQSFVDNVTDELANGGEVALLGFGTFSTKDRAARTGRNPRTGEALAIAEARLPAFKAGKALKDAVQL